MSSNRTIYEQTVDYLNQEIKKCEKGSQHQANLLSLLDHYTDMAAEVMDKNEIIAKKDAEILKLQQELAMLYVVTRKLLGTA